MQNIYLARQPILDLNARICAYEVLFRDMNKESVITGDRYASAAVISNVLNKFGKKELLEDKRGFVKIDEKFLLNDIIFSVPKEFFVFDLLEYVAITERVVERLAHLADEGYVLGLNDTQLTLNTFEKYAHVLKYLSFFKLDFERGLDDDTSFYIKELKKYNIQVIASKVEDHESYEIAKKLGADCFQGYFFAKPKILENAKYEASQFDVLKLYNLLMQDTSIDEITTEFEKSPEITVQLLQFMNSGAFHFRNKISSIHHVITLMGRVTLAKWLMLMIYSKSLSKNKNHKPLMLMVQNRIELMEIILKDVEPNVKSDRLGEAYLVAVLSLIDTIFSMKLEDILEGINISESVKEALLDYNNIFGEILQVILFIENSNFKGVTQFESDNSLASGTVQKAVVRAIENVNHFNHPEMV
ncbi:EAL domain-containing protein [Sulfurimonas sp.]|uniref:EAL and HDOD domain-containing protein n=1 Tax=Sulfurimonas sp. TaxID=2022749 RepID=UPI0026312E0B|nr:EAL domain-containing protein [Sulfurimonas sp.]